MYEELIKALRSAQTVSIAWKGLMVDAAAAIEELDAEETRLLLITSELQDKVVELEEELNDADIAADDNARQVEELQVEVGRLKAANDELREAQTYIDHYGDKWLTSAKDVPTSAYNHGYMDGKNEAEQALEPKRGEWIDRYDEDDKPFFKRKYVCSACGGWNTYGKSKYCPKCGAKMEVQE